MAILQASALFLVAAAVLRVSDARKEFKQCDFVNELKSKNVMPVDQIATWSCIVWHESKYVTDVVSPKNKDGSHDHGIFQINDGTWCSPPNKGKGCGVPCDALKDDDITQAVICARKVWLETQRVKGDGYKAWDSYKNCDTPAKVAPFIAGC